MLRKITIGCAVVVAMLAAPVVSAHSMVSGMGGMHSSGGMHPHMATGWGSHHAMMFPHHHFAHFHHFHHFARFHGFHHFAHFRHRHVLFASAIGVGSCWRWVPTRWGWHRVWVC